MALAPVKSPCPTQMVMTTPIAQFVGLLTLPGRSESLHEWSFALRCGADAVAPPLSTATLRGRELIHSRARGPPVACANFPRVGSDVWRSRSAFTHPRVCSSPYLRESWWCARAILQSCWCHPSPLERLGHSKSAFSIARALPALSKLPLPVLVAATLLSSTASAPGVVVVEPSETPKETKTKPKATMGGSPRERLGCHREPRRPTRQMNCYWPRRCRRDGDQGTRRSLQLADAGWDERLLFKSADA